MGSEVNTATATQAKVDLCDSSRGGTSRCKKAVQASDHDMGLKDKLAPFGILNMMTGLLTVLFGVSFETSDFIVDCLEQGWNVSTLNPMVKAISNRHDLRILSN